IYQAQTIEQVRVGSTAAGKVSAIDDIQLVQQTTTVSMRPGIRFGFRYSVIGSPNGATVPVKVVTLFPERGLYNPDKGQPFYRDEYMPTLALGATAYTGYRFGQPWELVPGVWVFQIWYQDRMLAEQRFMVVWP